MAKKTIKKAKKKVVKKKATEVLKPDEVKQAEKDYSFIRKEAADLCEEMDVNPFEKLLDVVAGKGLTENHPYLSKFKSKIKELVAMIEAGEEITVEQITALGEEVENQLTDKYVPHELRIKAMIETTKYILPQLQSIKVRQENLNINLDLKPSDITPKDIEAVKRMIDDR